MQFFNLRKSHFYCGWIIRQAENCLQALHFQVEITIQEIMIFRFKKNKQEGKLILREKKAANLQ